MTLPTLKHLRRHLVVYSRRRLLFALLFWAGLALLVALFYQHQTGPMTPQSRANLRFAADPGFASAFERYPRVWPPLYPSVLWAAVHLGVPVRVFNALCFYLTLVLVGYVFRRQVRNVRPAIPVLLIAGTHAHYVTAYQQVSEPFFVLLALLALLLLRRYYKAPSVATVLGLGAVSVAACLTRFFGLFWIVPLVAGHVALAGPRRPLTTRLYHTGLFAAVVAVGVGPYLLWLRQTTGSFSGMDRTAPRSFIAARSNWNELTDFGTNVLLTLRTAVVDLFSPLRAARREVVLARDFSVAPLEGLAFAVAALLLFLMGLVVVRRYRRARRTNQRSRLQRLLASSEALAFHFALVYVAALIALWTVSNNDPVYTRFLQPTYAFAALAGCSLYARLKPAAQPWERMPFRLLFLFFLAVNLLKLFADVWQR